MQKDVFASDPIILPYCKRCRQRPPGYLTGQRENHSPKPTGEALLKRT
jgi:hypothetical protein